MRVWFLKETKSLCTSCATGCNIVIGSREDKVYRYEPRQNDAVNVCWMCDYGRLNYKWIGREDRLVEVRGPKVEVRSLEAGVLSPNSRVQSQKTQGGSERWQMAMAEISEKLAQAPKASLPTIASAGQTNGELYLLSKLAKKLGALTDSVPRTAEGDKLLLNADRNPNTNGARLTGICFSEIGEKIPEIARGIEVGSISTLMVFGEDVTRHGISRELLGKL